MERYTEGQKHSLLGGFAWRTTFHGLHYVCWEYAKPRRAVWLVLWLLCVILFIYTLTTHLSHYYSYPKKTEVDLVHTAKMHPTQLTLCNMNPLSMSHLTDEKLDDPLRAVLESGKDLSGSLDAITARQFWDAVSQPPGDFITRCHWKSQPCPRDSWKVTASNHGHCYTFSPGEGATAGPVPHVVVNLGTDDEFTPLAGDQGVKVYLHLANMAPMVEHKSPDFFLTPGFHTQASVKLIQVKRLHIPYGNCGDVNNCTRCFTRQIVSKCGCVPYFLKDESTGDVACNVTSTILCAGRPSQEPHVCECPVPCDDVTYDVSVTQTRLTDTSLQRIHGINISRDSLAQLTVGDSQIIRYTEVVSYPLSELMRDMGVNLLLFLGASILSLLELLDFLIEACLKCHNKKVKEAE